MIRLFGVADGNRWFLHPSVRNRNCACNSFQWFFPWFLVVSLHAIIDQYSVEQSKENFHRSSELFLCISHLSSILSFLSQPSALSFKSQSFSHSIFVPPPCAVAWKLFQWSKLRQLWGLLHLFLVSQDHYTVFQCFHSLPPIVLGRRVNLVPITSSWLEAEVRISLCFKYDDINVVFEGNCVMFWEKLKRISLKFTYMEIWLYNYIYNKEVCFFL